MTSVYHENESTGNVQIFDVFLYKILKIVEIPICVSERRNQQFFSVDFKTRLKLGRVAPFERFCQQCSSIRDFKMGKKPVEQFIEQLN